MAGRNKPKLDYDALQRALDIKGPQSRLYQMIRIKMQELGHWKARPRGRAFTYGYDRRRKRT